MRQLVLITALLLSSVARADITSADYTDTWQVYAHELLRDSVAFRSFKGEQQVVPLVEFLAQEFLEAGFPEQDVRILPMESEGEPVASLVVRYRGISGDKKAILFSGHSDVVPATGEWRHDPFVLTEDDDRYWGRGVLDDKFATTILTTTFLRLRQEGFQPERDLIIAFSGDEETMQLTAQALSEQHLDLIDAELAFVLDGGSGRLTDDFKPVALYLQSAEKTYMDFRLTARNAGGHSAKPTGTNAIADIAKAIAAIHEYDFPVQSNDETRAYFSAMGKLNEGELGAAMRRFGENPDDKEAANFLAGQPDLVGLTRTTCEPTLVSGGHVENALPEIASVNVNCRIFPGETVDDVLATLQAVVDNPGIEFLKDYAEVSSPASAVRSDVVALVADAMADKYADVPIIPYLESGGTDGLYFRRAGITSYGLYGLFLRDGDDQSHSNNENVRIDHFYEALEFWYRFTKTVSAL